MIEAISVRDDQMIESNRGPTPTHCPYCALQCGMNLVRKGGTIKVAPREFPTSNGGLCQKGWTAAELLGHRERLDAPLIRGSRSSEFRAASWDEALDRIAIEFEKIQRRDGRDAIGVFGGGGLTNEKAYLLGKFARVALATRNIDYNGRFCMASAAAASLKAFGLDRGLPFPLTDIAGAETILLVGANVAETMPPIMQYFEAQRRRGGNLIVADPRATPTARASRLHLQLTPGTDAALANGLLHIAIAEDLIDHEFIAARTIDYESARKTAVGYWPERVERLTGVPAHQLYEAARMLGRSSTAMILTARGAEQQSNSVNNLLALINLALALGKSGMPHCGFGCLTGQGNGQGGREHGQKSDQLPGYRNIEDIAAREHIGRIWEVSPDSIPHAGTSACEMLDAAGAEGGVRAMLVIGSNIAVSAPNARRIREHLAALDFLVVADFFMSETAQLADVVLPSAQWAEEDGTVTNLEGRVILRRRAAMPPRGVRTDLEILSALANRLGFAGRFPSKPEAVFDELRRASAGGAADYAGISYERLAKEPGVCWPCPDELHPGTPRIFLDRYATPDGRARFHAIEFRPPGEVPDDDFPLYLTTGRIAAHYQSGTQTRRVTQLVKAERDAFVEIHPATARALGIVSGGRVRIVTRRGAATFNARISATIRMDTLFVPFHWAGDSGANALTNPALDPVSGMPEFKVCAARAERIAHAAQSENQQLSDTR